MSGEPEMARVLLVEGPSDKHVVIHLRDKYESVPSFDILDKEGIDRLIPSIYSEVNAPDRTALGILADANDNLSNRWDSIAYQLSRAGIHAPPGPERDGTIIEGRIRVGIWLMPDNQSRGELEDFVVRLIPGSPDPDPIWPKARTYIGSIPEEHRKFKSSKELRAQLYAWLATRKEPRQMGLAIRTGDLDANQETAKAFVEWLRGTFR